ncbi:MAG: ATP-binding protein [Desertifilum sp.]|nr:ATP-binding protein [Desertifilum sp.]
MMSSSSLQVFGESFEENQVSEEYLTLHFSPSSKARTQRWKNYGLSADFLGDYFANFFPGETIPGSQIDRRETVRSMVSYVANELLENAMKYSDKTVNLPVTISLYLYDTNVMFTIENYIDCPTAERYQTFIQELLASDREDFYTRQLEKAALGQGQSAMGLLTTIQDYSARLGWKFQRVPDQPNIIWATTMAQLEV